MPRKSRVVIEGCPHHVYQQGNRRQQVFFTDEDRRFYLAMFTSLARECGVRVWAYCLMTNHVHLILVPTTKEGLRQAVGETHKHYAWRINRRFSWRGYLWQGRFGSKPLSESHFYTALRYVERNPVRAGMVARAEDYSWSSARAHVTGERDPFLSHCPLIGAVRDWSGYIRTQGEDELRAFRAEIFVKRGRPKKGHKLL
jgi:putative transposase